MNGAARALVDTNVLVYADDASEPVKRGKALSALEALALAGDATVSTQVLAEYLVTMNRKFPQALPDAEAVQRLDRWTAVFDVLAVDVSIVREALRATLRYQLHYYDAQIWASAKAAGADIILTEDIPAAGEIEGVHYVNPFADGFDPATLTA